MPAIYLYDCLYVRPFILLSLVEKYLSINKDNAKRNKDNNTATNIMK